MTIKHFIAPLALCALPFPALAEPLQLYCSGVIRVYEMGDSEPRAVTDDAFYIKIDPSNRKANVASAPWHPEDEFSVEVSKTEYKNLSNTENPEHGKGIRNFTIDRQTLSYFYMHPVSGFAEQANISSSGTCTLYEPKI